jgi:hypothetical protein
VTTTLDHAAEAIARKIDRRRFLSRSAGAIFAATAMATVAGIRAPFARASGNCPAHAGEYDSCSCHPPGPYCTQWSSSFCSGAACAGGCSYDYFDYQADACWCTLDCCYLCGGCNSYCGYWTCCDCKGCPGHSGKCGCRSFTYTCTVHAASPAMPDTSNTGIPAKHAARRQTRPDCFNCC